MRFRHLLILTLILGLLPLCPGCKLFTRYDIQGTWEIVKSVDGIQTTYMAVFAEYANYKDSGWVQVDSVTYGTYRMEFDDEITFVLYYFVPGSTVTSHKANFRGGFDSKNTMSGTVEEVNVNEGYEATGTWQAVRYSEPL